MKNRELSGKSANSEVRQTSRSIYEPVYTIGVAAQKLCVSVHTLRLYESEGLIIPFKTETGRRLYSDLELEKAKCIRSMIKDDGLNLEGIRRLMSLVPCWKIRKCDSKNGKECNAYLVRTRPCWDTKEKCIDPLPSCRDCEVYRNLVHCEDVKKYL